jgi:hypothetical protein
LPQRSQVKLLVGNHVSVIEVMILFVNCFPSFVSRVENLTIPLFPGIVKVTNFYLKQFWRVCFEA